MLEWNWYQRFVKITQKKRKKKHQYVVNLRPPCNLLVKQCGKVPHKVLQGAFEYFHLENALYKCNIIIVIINLSSR